MPASPLLLYSFTSILLQSVSLYFGTSILLYSVFLYSYTAVFCTPILLYSCNLQSVPCLVSIINRAKQQSPVCQVILHAVCVSWLPGGEWLRPLLAGDVEAGLSGGRRDEEDLEDAVTGWSMRSEVHVWRGLRETESGEQRVWSGLVSLSSPVPPPPLIVGENRKFVMKIFKIYQNISKERLICQ